MMANSYDLNLLDSMSPEDLKKIQDYDFSPLDKMNKTSIENIQQPQASLGNQPVPMNQNPYHDNSAIRNLVSGLASGGYENVRGLADLMGLNLKPRQFWGDPESNTFGAARFLGKYGVPFAGGLKAAKAIGTAAPALRNMASWLPEALGFGAVGAVAHPGTLEERLGRGALDAASVPAWHGAVKAFRGAKQGLSNTRENLKYATPGKFQEQTTQTLEDLFKGKPVTSKRENKLVFGEINKKGNANKDISNEMYKKTIQESVDKGYDGLKKKIDFNARNVLKNKKLKRSIDKDSEVSTRFSEFLNSPSFKNAHDLQAILNERSFKLKHPLNDMASQNLGTTYRELRNQVLEAMESTLKKHGDISVLKSYQDATKNYAENVVPYIKTRAMRDITESMPKEGKYIFPEDSIALLTKNKSGTQKVVSDLPEKSKRFLFQKMIEGARTGDNIDPVKLKRLIHDIKSSRKVNLVPKEDLKKLQDLLERGNRLEMSREFVKKNQNKFFLATGAAGAIPVYKAWKALVSKED